MEILYDFKRYEKPKKCYYWAESDKYELPEGWVRVKKEMLVIGECDDSYTEELSELDGVLVPLGFHKSRFICWCDMQLSFF